MAPNMLYLFQTAVISVPARLNSFAVVQPMKRLRNARLFPSMIPVLTSSWPSYNTLADIIDYL